VRGSELARAVADTLGVALAGALYTAAGGTSHRVSLDTAAYGLTAALVTLACLALAGGVTLLFNRSIPATEGDRLPAGFLRSSGGGEDHQMDGTRDRQGR
jgi:cytochrome bd-type quinol oxidase subunit 2